MNPARREWISIEQYLAMREQSEVRLEWQDGEVFAMSGGTMEHAQLAANVIIALGAALRGRPCRVLTTDMSVRGDARFSYPDVSVVCGEPRFFDKRRDTLMNPVVLFEVLSPSTERNDRGLKF